MVKLNYNEKQAIITILPYVRIARTQLEPYGTYNCLRLLHVGFCAITS